jgi:hypothetical protein
MLSVVGLISPSAKPLFRYLRLLIELFSGFKFCGEQAIVIAVVLAPNRNNLRDKAPFLVAIFWYLILAFYSPQLRV